MRPPVRDAREVPDVRSPRFAGTETDIDSDAFRTQAFVPLPRDFRVGILQR